MSFSHLLAIIKCAASKLYRIIRELTFSISLIFGLVRGKFSVILGTN